MTLVVLTSQGMGSVTVVREYIKVSRTRVGKWLLVVAVVHVSGKEKEVSKKVLTLSVMVGYFGEGTIFVYSPGVGSGVVVVYTFAVTVGIVDRKEVSVHESLAVDENS